MLLHWTGDAYARANTGTNANSHHYFIHTIGDIQLWLVVRG
jgi:hypothetical protein